MNTNKKIVLVTGGTKGLGLEIVKNLCEAGYKVVAASREITSGLEEVIEKSDSVFFEPLDLKNSASLHLWSKTFISKHGVPYALVNNAAAAHDGILGTMHESQILEVIGVNVTSTIILTKYITRAMLIKRVGRVVNISSIIASTGFNGLSVYAASKAALNGFTKSLARELGKARITVNSVAPGYMQTDMTAGINEKQLDQIRRRSALKRLANTTEVASSIRYLLSEEAAAITGTVITIDAGNTA